MRPQTANRHIRKYIARYVKTKSIAELANKPVLKRALKSSLWQYRLWYRHTDLSPSQSFYKIHKLNVRSAEYVTKMLDRHFSAYHRHQYVTNSQLELLLYVTMNYNENGEHNG